MDSLQTPTGISAWHGNGVYPRQCPPWSSQAPAGWTWMRLLAADGFDPSVYGIPPHVTGWSTRAACARAPCTRMCSSQPFPLCWLKKPHTCFICPSLAGNAQAQAWVEQFGLQQSTHLLPKLPQPMLWSLLKRSQVFVSPSSHDGTPNSLLEAMACGSFPVVGDIESMREWIEPGVNGLLVDPHSPRRNWQQPSAKH
jgi:hypothetical protein